MVDVKFKEPQLGLSGARITRMRSFKFSNWKSGIYILMVIFSSGIVILVSRWYQALWIFCRLTPCKIEEAQFIQVESDDKTSTICTIKRRNLRKEKAPIVSSVKGRIQIRICYRFMDYTYDVDQNCFELTEYQIANLQYKHILDYHLSGIQSIDTAIELQQIYGKNSTQIQDQGIMQLLINEVLSPFYLFQIFCLSIWFAFHYETVAGVILLLTTLSISQNLFHLYKNSKELVKLSNSESMIKVLRGSTQGLDLSKDKKLSLNVNPIGFKSISSDELVVGDLVLIEAGMKVPCDIILLTSSVLINEGSITGESYPMTKTSITYSDTVYNPQNQGREHTLFSGTECINVRPTMLALGIVSKIGFSTFKGQLIREMIFTTPKVYHFEKDYNRYLFALFILFIILNLITLKTRIELAQLAKTPFIEIIVQYLLMVTTCIPPVFPTCLQIGLSFSFYRLSKLNIKCTNINHLNVAGQVTVMCFDKTGTITEDFCEVQGVRMVYGHKNKEYRLGLLQTTFNQEVHTECPILPINIRKLKTFNVPENFLYNLSCCHTLNLINNKIEGDHLEKALFKFTGSSIIQSTEFEQSIESQYDGQIKSLHNLRKFEYQSHLQCMSVITLSEDQMAIYTKGSFDKLKKICQPQTLPIDIHTVVQLYSQAGFRLIACAMKPYWGVRSEIMSMSREDIETDLIFLGIVILQNNVKQGSVKIIQNLQNANIRTIMITGDNIFTAISISKQCGIVLPNQHVICGDLEISNQGQQLIWKDCEGSVIGLTINQILSLGDKVITLAQSIGSSQSQVEEILSPDNQDEHSSLQISEYQNINQESVPPWISSQENLVFAVTGQLYEYLFLNKAMNDSISQKLLERIQIYARTKPDQKASIVTRLQHNSKKQIIVGFCGDGINDLNVLKAANIGISFKKAGAMIASSFSTRSADLSCVTNILLEGRAALTTSMICFKFIFTYSIIQSVGTTILFMGLTSFSDGQYLFIDLITVLPIVVAIGITEPTNRLSKHIPKGTLLSVPVLASLVGQAIIQTSFMIAIFLRLMNEPWLIKAMELLPEDTNYYYTKTYESTTISLFTNPQYIFVAIAYSNGRPFRKGINKNKVFIFVLVILLFLHYLLILLYYFPDNFLYLWQEVFFLFKFKYLVKTQNSAMPPSWIMFILWFSIFNGLVTLLYERLAVVCIANMFNALSKK